MRSVLALALLLTLPAAASAQMDNDTGMPGGGMGGGGMGGGGGPPGGAAPGGRPHMMKPVKRDKIDAPVEEMFRAADADKDGTVTISELKSVLDAQRQEVVLARFREIDANGDKLIDQSEFVAWQKTLGSVALSGEAMDKAVGGVIPDSLPPHLGKTDTDDALRLIIDPLNAVVLVNANTNYDKGVTLAELLAYERQRFDAADADKDGELSMQEMRGLEAKAFGGRAPRGPGEGGAPPSPPPGGRPRD